MGVKEMLETVQRLKEDCVLNGGIKTAEIEQFLNDNWMQILDILDDALFYEYEVNKVR